MRLSEIPVDEVDRLQQVALMRLILRVIAETHRILGGYQQWLTAWVERQADRDGEVGPELGQGIGEVSSRYRAVMGEWKALFAAGQQQAAAIPVGAWLVRHNQFMTLVQQPVEEELSAGELGTLIRLWQGRRERALQAATARTYGDGLTLSDRIWRLENTGLARIRGTLAMAMTERTNAYDLARQLEGALGANQDLPRWTWERLYRMTPAERARDATGLLRDPAQRTQGVAYNALRLARTELQNANHAVTSEIARRSPWITGRFVRLSPSHPKIDICDEYANGGPYSVNEEILSLHPNCLCRYEEDLMSADEFTRQTRSWLEGENRFLDDYATWLGTQQPTELIPWNLSEAESLEMWLAGTEDTHAALLRLPSGAGPVVPPIVPPPVPSGEPTAAQARERIKQIRADNEKLIEKERKAYDRYTKKNIDPLYKQLDDLLDAASKAKTDAERAEIDRKYQGIVNIIDDHIYTRERFKRNIVELERSLGGKAREAVYVQNPAENRLRGSSLNITPEESAHWQKGMDEFNRLVDRGVWTGNPVDVIRLAPGERAYHSGGRIYVTSNEPTRVIVHEIGHAFEQQSGVYPKVKAFYDRRTEGDKLEKLSEVTGSKAYNDDEVTRRDKWLHPYMGKDYGRDATEIVSMGLEWMYAEPQRLAEDDPEYFDFIFDLVRGR